MTWSAAHWSKKEKKLKEHSSSSLMKIAQDWRSNWWYKLQISCKFSLGQQLPTTGLWPTARPPTSCTSQCLPASSTACCRSSSPPQYPQPSTVSHSVPNFPQCLPAISGNLITYRVSKSAAESLNPPPRTLIPSLIQSLPTFLYMFCIPLFLLSLHKL